MAAVHSNKSPSPLRSGPAANPNPRNSENNLGIRRSFSSKPSALTNQRRFDPTTPANSPSDFGARRSVSEEKENEERDLKASKIQSPAAKGTKNFMAPTISAASKFTPSPRKKVLVERNDPVRTSISLSDGKAMFFSNISPNVSGDFNLKSEKDSVQNQKSDRVVEPKADGSEKKVDVLPVSKPSKRVSFFDIPSEFSQHESESVITDLNSADSDILNIESSLKKEAISSTSIAADSDNSKFDSSLKNEAVSSTPIAPLDADPSLAPYDPKTNYLSPRPQFLHYKPNPRIEILLSKEKGLDAEEFEEETMSENISDASEGTQESQTENIESEEWEEMGCSAHSDMVIGMDELEADSEPSETLPVEPSETLPVSTPVNDAVSEEEFVPRNGMKSRVLFRLMCFSMLVMLLIACASISFTHTKTFNEFVIKDLSLSDLSNFYEQSRAVVSSSAKANFNRIAKHVNQFSVSSISWVSKLANEIGNGGKQVPFQFMNLSELQRDAWNEGHFLQNDASMELVEDLEEDEVEEEWNADQLVSFEEEEEEEDEPEEVADDREAYAEIDFDEREMPIESEEVAELDQESNHETAIGVAEINTESEEPHIDSFTPAVEVAEISVESEEPRVDISTPDSSGDQPAAIAPQYEETNLEPAIEVAETNPETKESHVDISTPGSSAYAQTEDRIQSPSEYNSMAQIAMGASSLIAAALAVAAALYYQCKKKPRSADVIQPDSPLLNKETGHGFASTKQVNKVRESSQNWQTEDDHHGESLSEMSSSFQKSASYSKNGGGGANEVESSERKIRKFPRRESLASSSTELSMGGSPSYGSFTTFERIPIKHAYGEEEIVTPVRRSSRIRKHQFTSP